MKFGFVVLFKTNVTKSFTHTKKQIKDKVYIISPITNPNLQWNVVKVHHVNFLLYSDGESPNEGLKSIFIQGWRFTF